MTNSVFFTPVILSYVVSLLLVEHSKIIFFLQFLKGTNTKNQQKYIKNLCHLLALAVFALFSMFYIRLDLKTHQYT